MAKRKFKVKRKVVGGQKSFRPWKEFDEGDVIIGKYIGTHIDQYDKTCRIVEVEEAIFSDGTGADYEGKNLVLNSVGLMDKGFKESEIEEGTILQITYGGTSVIEKGKYAGKEAHLVEMDIVEEDYGDDEEEDGEDGL